MLEVNSVAEVFSLIQSHFSGYNLPAETVILTEAVGRVLAEDLLAGENIPGFTKSAVDGYAVISEDTFGASDSLPARLLKGQPVVMGKKPGTNLTPGTASYIPTGGALPPGADGIVMVEYSDDYDDEYIYLTKPAAPGAHMIFAGDDIREGQKLLQAGQRLSPAAVGMLAALGIDQVKVKKKPVAGIIATGDEIISVDKTPSGAQVRDINSYVLSAALSAYMARPVLYGIIRDDFNLLKKTTLKALEECDLVLISGGSSAGLKDMTADIIRSLGEPGVLVHGIAVKPGKPTIIGKIGSKPVLGLPGHPASAFMICTVFITALLDILTGTGQKEKVHIQARAAQNYPSNSGREEYVPVELIKTEEGYTASVLPGKSGQIRFLARAAGYIHISREKEGILAGETVRVILAPGAAYGL